MHTAWRRGRHVLTVAGPEARPRETMQQGLDFVLSLFVFLRVPDQATHRVFQMGRLDQSPQTTPSERLPL
jgi:hypothetical protein